MKIVFYSKAGTAEQWRKAVTEAIPSAEFCVWPDIGSPENVDYTLAWRPCHGWHRQFPNLKAIMALGAGVDALLEDPELPEGVPVVRLLDAGMGRQMAEYALYGVMHFHRRMHEYSSFQRDSVWKPLTPVSPEHFSVGIMGLGVLGRQVADRLLQSGYPVLSWTLSRKNIPDIKSYCGMQELNDFLQNARTVINLLPLTPLTTGLVNRAFLSALPTGASLINLARGKHIVESDLIEALDSGHLGGAMLDVFEHEPLPPGHPFWWNPKIMITPHVAALTIPEYASAQVIANIRRIEAGLAPAGIVDRRKGY